MNALSPDKEAAVADGLAAGLSIRDTARQAGVSKITVQARIRKAKAIVVTNHRCPVPGAAHFWACGQPEPCPLHPERVVCPEHEGDILDRQPYRDAPSELQGTQAGPDDDAEHSVTTRTTETQTVERVVEVKQRKVRRSLTDEEVVAIRQLYVPGGEWTHKGLAARFGVSAGTINDVINGSSYRSVGGPLRVPETDRRFRAELAESQLQLTERAEAEESHAMALSVPPVLSKLPAHRDALRAALRETERAILATEVVGRIPSHYVRIAERLLDSGGPVARAKLIAAVAAVLVWDDFWGTMDDYTNDVMDPLEDDLESITHDALSDAAEAIMGKEPERAWVHPRPKEEAPPET